VTLPAMLQPYLAYENEKCLRCSGVDPSCPTT
jgi:hypothetical protein